jgi:nitronate monooxygenase
MVDAMIPRLASLGIRYPVMQAGMPGIADATLVAAVAKAGGIGTLGLQDVSVWEAKLAETKQAAAGHAIAVNLLLPYTRARHVDAVLRQAIPIVTLFWGHAPKLISRLQRSQVFVFQQVGSKTEAQEALDDGVDALIVQGTEAGGHVRGTQRLEQLLPQVAELAKGVALFAAGGIYTSADVRRAVALGATGVSTGTRFLLTHESDAHPAYKQRLLEADRTILTKLFGLGWPDLHRVVPNEATKRWCDPDGAISSWQLAVYAAAATTRSITPMREAMAAWQRPAVPLFTPTPLVRQMPASLLEATALYAGEHVAQIKELMSAGEVVTELAKGFTSP